MTIKTYFPSINLLRAVAAIMVCYSHLVGYIDVRGPLFNPEGWFIEISKLGLNGIYIFFVVSGFVIPLSLIKAKYSIQKFPRFIWRRFLRIELPYFASIAMAYLIKLIYSIKNQSPFEIDFQQLFYHVVYFIEFTDLRWLDGVYWTLAIEFQFYILIGLLFGLFYAKNNWIVGISLLALAASNFLVSHDDRFIFHYATLFLQGILLCMVIGGRINKTIGYTGILICFLLTIYFHSFTIALFGGMAVVTIQFLHVNHAIVNRMGDISYSMYLTHAIIAGQLLYLFYSYFHTPIERMVLVGLVFIAVLLFAYFFWYIVERPARKLAGKVRIGTGQR